MKGAGREGVAPCDEPVWVATRPTSRMADWGERGAAAELRTKQPARFLWLQLRLWLLLQHSSTKLQYFAVVELNLGNERQVWVLRMLQR
jgi:hypothetical protein